MNRFKLLLLGGGTRLSHLESFQRFFQVHITDTFADSPTARCADGSMISGKGFSDPGFDEDLEAYVRERAIDVVLPASHYSIAALNRARGRLARLGTLVLLSPSGSLEIAENKTLTLKCFKSLGLKAVEELAPENVTAYPVHVKSRTGGGNKHNLVANAPEQLKAFLSLVPDPLIQRQMKGQEYTVDVFCDLRSKVVSVVPRTRDAIFGNEMVKGTTVRDRAMMLDASRIAESLNAIGPICIQAFKEQDGTVYYSEVNMRFGGGITLSIRAGADVPLFLHKILAKEPLNRLEEWEEGLRVTRAFRDIYFHG